MVEMLSPQRKIVIETGTILMRLFGDFTLHEIAENAEMEPEAVKRQFQKLRDLEVMMPVEDASGKQMARNCRESGRRMVIYQMIAEAMTVAEDHADSVSERVALHGRTAAGFDWSYEPKLGIPTKARPGSPEKIEVMAARYRRGEAAIHPADAGYDGTPLNAS